MATMEATTEATMEATIEETICQTCGDIGFTVALIYCDKCQFSAVHRYCLDTLPATFEEYVTWLCVDCEPKNEQLSTFNYILSLPAHESCPDEVETMQVIQSRLTEMKTVKKKKKKKSKFYSSKKKVKNQRKEEAAYSLTEAGVLSTEINRPSELIELNCEDSHQIVEKIPDKESSEVNSESDQTKTSVDQTKISVVSTDKKPDHVICEERDPHVGSSDEKVKLKNSIVAIEDNINIPEVEHGDDMRLNEVKSDTKVKSLKKKKQKKKKSAQSLNRTESCTPSSTPTEPEVSCEKINEKVKMGQSSENLTEKAESAKFEDDHSDIPELDCGDAQLDRGNPDEAAKSKKKTKKKKKKKKHISDSLAKIDIQTSQSSPPIEPLELQSGESNKTDQGKERLADKTKTKTSFNEKRTKNMRSSEKAVESETSIALANGHSNISELDCRDGVSDEGVSKEVESSKKKKRKRETHTEVHNLESNPPVDGVNNNQEVESNNRDKKRKKITPPVANHDGDQSKEKSIKKPKHASIKTNVEQTDSSPVDGVNNNQEVESNNTDTKRKKITSLVANHDGDQSKEKSIKKPKHASLKTNVEQTDSSPVDGGDNNQQVESNNTDTKRKKITPLVAKHDGDQSKEKSIKKPKHASVKTNVEQTGSSPVDGDDNNQQVKSNNPDTKRKKITPLVANSDVRRLESIPPIELEMNCGDNLDRDQCKEKSVKKRKHASNKTTGDPTDSPPVDGGNNNQQVESNNTDTKRKKITPVVAKSDALKHESRPPIELKMNCGENHDRDQCKEKSIKKPKHASIKTTVDPAVSPPVDGGKNNQQVESNNMDTKRKKTTPLVAKSDVRKLESNPPIEFEMNCGENHDRDQCKATSIKKSKHARSKTAVDPTDDLSEIPKLNSSIQERRGLDVVRYDEEVNTKNSKVVSNHNSITPELYVPAQPIIEPVWRGCFDLHRQNFGSIGLVAHLSSLACQRVWDTAKLLSASLRPELLLRSYIWPKGFEKSGPNDDSIALYFFPDSRREEMFFDTLMDEMIRKDLAMRAKVENVELLLFTSVQLPVQFQRFQSRFYLWGVFRGKQAPLQIEGVVSVEGKTNPKSSVLKSKTPVSSLKNCGNYQSGSKRRPIHSSVT